MPRRMLALVGLLCSCSLAFSQADRTFSLMPVPRVVNPGSGRLAIDEKFSAQVQAPGDQLTWAGANRCLQTIKKLTGLNLAQEHASEKLTRVPGTLSIVVHHPATMQIGTDESYSLTIAPDGARLEASNSIGALRGLATFRQLLQQDKQQFFLPAVTIEDSPRYPWRGLMIDPARHFVPIDALKRNIDAMELVKLNVLHLHLSDNEGFRVESKIFPELQAKGSEGNYYTQLQIRDLIQYAQARGIVIVPEFDMPSHAVSWLAGYPMLSSSPGPFKPGVLPIEGLKPHPSMADIMELMKTMDTIKTPALDPTRESTYAFLDRFVGEMSLLFNAPYFHIGADENNGAIWRANPEVVAYMQAHHLADTAALQVYFVSRMRAIVEKHGKQMVAWEEGFSPTDSSNTIFQMWSPMAKVDLSQLAIANNNKLLGSTGYYLDRFLPAHAHYLSDPMPATANEAARKSLLGGEATMFSELEDRANFESRVWPRAGAVAERLWSPAEVKDVPDMYRRLFLLTVMLDQAGVHNLVDYQLGVRRLAGTLPAAPVETLLDVLAPQKGAQRILSSYLKAIAEPSVPRPLDSVADVVLVDSSVKYEFRNAVDSYLKSKDPASGEVLRHWLLLWSRNDALLQPYIAQSSQLREVEDHSKNLAAMANVGLKTLDARQRGEQLPADEIAAEDAMLKAAEAAHGETQIVVLPEIEALVHGNLVPEPSTYPLF